MAIINIKNFGKITVSDPFARQVKKKWEEMKSGLFPSDSVVEIGEFTGTFSDITGFMIEPERKYETALPSGDTSLSHDETAMRIKSIGDLLRKK